MTFNKTYLFVLCNVCLQRPSPGTSICGPRTDIQAPQTRAPRPHVVGQPLSSPVENIKHFLKLACVHVCEYMCMGN